MTDVNPAVERMLRQTYDAFNRRDIEAVLNTMHPSVDWPNGWEGGRVVGHDAVRDYWTRQFAAIRVRVEPVAFAATPDGRVAIDVQQSRLGDDGEVLQSQLVRHVYQLRDGLVERMDIEPAG